MKTFFFLPILFLVVISCSSQLDEQELIFPKNQNNHINQIYENGSEIIMPLVSNTFNELGFRAYSKSSTDYTILDVINLIPVTELSTIINSSKGQQVIAKREDYTDKTINIFFENFTTDDYLWFRQSVFEYLKEGGHNTDYISKLAKHHSNQLNKILTYACVYADILASKNFWKSTGLISNMGRGTIAPLEEECRRQFYDKIRYMVVENGLDLGVELAGVATPGIVELEMLADIVGAAAFSYEYYQCMHGMIH